MAITGSVEIIKPDGTNIGVAGRALATDTVPVIVGALHAITDLEPKDVEWRAGQMPIAEWTGVDAQGQNVTVVLWAEPDFGGTEIGHAIAAAAAEAQEGGA